MSDAPDFKLPASWEETFKPEPEVDMVKFARVFRQIPKREWAAFFEKFRLQQLKGIFSSSEQRSAEALAIAKSTKQFQDFIGEILV